MRRQEIKNFLSTLEACYYIYDLKIRYINPDTLSHGVQYYSVSFKYNDQNYCYALYKNIYPNNYWETKTTVYYNCYSQEHLLETLLKNLLK